MPGMPGDGARDAFLRFPLSQEERLANAKSSVPTPIASLIFLVLFIALILGTANIQMGSEELGMAIYVFGGVVMVSLYLAGKRIVRGEAR